jgi:hypothetical protein
MNWPVGGNYAQQAQSLRLFNLLGYINIVLGKEGKVGWMKKRERKITLVDERISTKNG